MQAYDLIIYSYFCIGFIDFMLEKIILLNFTNIFLPSGYEENEL